MNTSKTVVILGGGTGGIIAANELRKKSSKEYKILLVEKNPDHTFAPSFLWVMAGMRNQNEVVKPLRSLLHPGVELVHAEALKIDPTQKLVITSSGNFHYDYLIISLGAELVFNSIPGLDKEKVHTFYTLEGAVKLHNALKSFKGGKIAIVVCSTPYKCPAAPHEGAMLIENYFRRQGIRDKVEIHIYTPEPQPMPVTGPDFGKGMVQLLSSKGIEFHPLHKINSFDLENKRLHFEGKEPVSFDLLIVIPPHRSPKVVQDSGLTNQTGWIPIDPYSLKTSYENVYAIGDVTALPLPGRWKPDVPLMLPKAGVFAHFQAEVVAKRIIDEINGRSPTAKFEGIGFCALEMGDGLGGLGFGKFFAEPHPMVMMKGPSKKWHQAKVLFEKWWLSSYGIKKDLYSFLISLGGKIYGIPV